MAVVGVVLVAVVAAQQCPLRPPPDGTADVTFVAPSTPTIPCGGTRDCNSPSPSAMVAAAMPR